jgi:uncharacterized membrane protein YbhN (UPF0104 family)
MTPIDVAIPTGRSSLATGGSRLASGAGPAAGAPAPSMPPAPAGRRLAIGSAVFAALTLGALWFQAAGIPPGAARPAWADLDWRYAGLLVLVLPVETAAAALRIWLLARILGSPVGVWTAVQAEWANAAVALLTPFQSGGGAGQVYVLHRGGMPIGTALTLGLLSFVGTMTGLAALGLYSLLVSRAIAAGPLFAGAAWTLTAIAGAMLAGALAPGAVRAGLAGAARAVGRLARRRAGPAGGGAVPAGPATAAPSARIDRLAARLAEFVDGFGRDVRRVLRLSKARFGAVCLLSGAFLLARAVVPYLCARFLGLSAIGLRPAVEAQLALVFLVFFAPTPGAAGIAEGASAAVMAPMVPPGFVPAYTLLWRTLGAYLPALAGLACLVRVLTADLRRARRRRA